MNLLPAVNPVVRVWDALVDEEPLYSYQPVIGKQMRELIPVNCGRAVLIVNGQALLQNEWHREVYVGDVIEWKLIAGGGNSSRTILTIIAIIVIAYFAGPIAGALGIGGTAGTAAVGIVLNIAAQLLINALIPIDAVKAGGGSTSPGSVYNTSLSANQARLFQPIPVIYGRMRTFPDFAGQPYAFYRNNDQYYSALFCIGQGEYTIEALQIDDTPIANFQSVYYKILPPGVYPAQVSAQMVTAIEVSGNTLEADRPVGGFIVNKPLTQIDRLYWDITANSGLGSSDNNGTMSKFSIVGDIDIQEVDDFNQPITPWEPFTTFKVAAKSRTPQRFSHYRDLPRAGRFSVRFTRTTAQDPSAFVSNTIELAGVRGRLTSPAPLCATATHLEVVMRANEQLNGLTQKKINVIARRKLQSWNPTDGWVAAAETRSPVWAAIDVLKSTVYGASRTDSEIDLEGLYELDLIYQARQDRLDILFDSRTTVRDALRTIGQVGRAVIFQRMGVFTAMRDQYQATPVAAYTTRDIIPGSTSIGYALPTPESADQIRYEYFDNRAWDWVPITVNIPGVTSPVNPVTLRVNGITGYHHALREVTYLAAVNVYRRKFPKWQTELKGLLAAYGSAVVFAPALPTWGHGGDVVGWEPNSLTATLSETPVFTSGSSHFITLEQSTGQLTVAIPVMHGTNANDVILGLDPGFDPITTDSGVERTKYVFGKEGEHRVIVRLLGVSSKGKTAEGNPIIEMSGVAENNLVHTADNANLPAGGTIQDPVPTTTVADTLNPTDAGSSIDQNVIVAPVSVVVAANVSFDGSDDGGGVRFKFLADGHFVYDSYGGAAEFAALGSPTSSVSVTDQWYSDDLEPGETAQFEVSMSVVANRGSGVFSGPTGFVSLGVDQAWTWGGGSSAQNLPDDQITFIPVTDSGDQTIRTTSIPSATFQLFIRRVGTTHNLVSTQFNAFLDFTTGGSLGGGGGDAGDGDC